MSLKGKEILIIDDAADNRLVARKILDSLGIKVIEADSTSRGLTLLGERMPHLVLLDLQMPQSSGFDFLQAKSRVDGVRQIPVVVVSGLKNRESVSRAASLGAIDYLLKPYTAAALMQKVRKHLRGKDFKRFQFPAADLPPGEIWVPANVVSVEETSIMIESPLRLHESRTIILESDQTERLELSTAVLMTGKTPSTRAPSGLYFSRINVMGTARTLMRKLRKAA